MSELHILNVGRADCCILLLDTPAGRRVVVVDGGELRYQGREPLAEFLRTRDIAAIDLLILTHLHQDHFGGLHQLIGKTAVRELVAPCGDLVFQEAVYPIFGDREFYREYHELFAYFAKSGTRMHTSLAWADRALRFADQELRCLYPRPESPMPSVAAARALCRPCPAGELEGLLARYQRCCNGDSSIWLLRRGGADVALLGGDSTDAAMDLALSGREVRPQVQKLSHHGIGEGYFSQETQARIRPKVLVVSVDKTHYNESMRRAVDGLCAAGGSEARYTFDGDFVYRF